MSSKRSLSRREVIGTVSALGGLALVHPFAPAFGDTLTPTPEQTAGPFYPTPRPLEQDMDLTMLSGHTERAQGTIVHLSGRVLDQDGKPVPGAKVEIWQANAAGRYDHPRDVNPAPLDPNFQGFGVQTTDAAGRYRFKTIKPGAYPINPMNPGAVRTPHVHFDVTQGKEHLVTQMYFPGESLNATDRIFAALGASRSAAVATIVPDAPDVEADAVLVHWDIVLTDARGT
jgi:protocatechuate 3,4-dioxygenase beta subunit